MSDQQDRPKCPNTPKYPCGDCPACQVPLAAPAGLHSWPPGFHEAWRQHYERAPAPPAAPEPATRPQAPAQPQDPAARPGIAPGRQLDSAGFGPWPSEEEIEAHGNGLWLIRQKGEMAPGQIRGMALGRFGKEEGRTVWWSGGRFSDQKYMSPWTFCPIDENGDKLGAAPVLRGKDATSLLESLANTAPPEGIARRREESRRRSSEGYYLEPKADPTVARILASLPPRQPERRVLVVLRGLPGSGKSTVAQAIVDSDPARWVRVSKDDLRQMMVGQGRNLFQFVEDKAREGLIAEAIKHVAGIALQGDLDVVVDATNLTSGNLDDWFEDVASWCAMWKEAPVLVCERAIDVSVEECVARDDRRPGYRRVGRAVIERLAATIDLELADRDHEVG